MFLDLSKIRAAREHYEGRYEPAAFSADGDSFSVAAPVALDLEIFKDKRQFRLVGTTKTTLELACGRCLEPFQLVVDASFDLRYQPHADAAATTVPDLEVEEDDLATAFYEDDRIDLGQLMREQFLLAVPMKPLCRDECRGLCVECGTNLNRGTCECRRTWEDPRFAALRELKTKH